MSLTFANYSVLTVDDLYHPTLVEIYSIYWDVSLCVTTVFFIFMLYTIVKKSSTEMKEYRAYLINQLTWSFLFDLHLGVWKPVPLWPFYLGYYVGWYSNIPKEYTLLPLIGVTFFSVGMGFSIFMSIIHRYIQVAPFSISYKRYYSLPQRLTHDSLLFVILECCFCLPLWIFKPDSDQLKNTIISQAEYMKFFFDKYPNLFGFAPEMNGGFSIIGMSILLTFLFGIMIFIVLLYFNFLRILKKNKQLLSVSTYDMQRMLFKTIIVQTFFAVFLLIVPITSCVVLAVFNVNWVSKFSLLMFMVTSTHTIADFVTLVCIVKPYRMFVIQCIDKLLKPLGFNILTLPTNAVAQSTSGIPTN